MNRLNVIGSSLTAIGFVAIVLSITGMVRGQSSTKAVGEVASASLTTINGSAVISGTTVFSKNRIRTDKQGTAIINLGRLGRIEFGSETDITEMTLRVSAESIGGELHSGRLVVSARAGVAVAINSAKGLVTTDGRAPAVLTIDLDSKRDLITAHRGEARIISADSDAAVITGAVRPSPPGGNPNTASTSSQIGGKSIVPGLGGLGMFNTGVAYSITQISSHGLSAAQSLETTITCRDSGTIRCENRSKYKP